MKRIIHFSRLFFPAAAVAVVLIIAGIAGYVIYGGFNLGVDFQAGVIQEIRFAPSALGIKYEGLGNAAISVDRNRIDIIISGSGVERTTHSFPFAVYSTIGTLSAALVNIEGIEVDRSASDNISSAWLIQSAQGNPQLSTTPYILHYLDPISQPIAIESVRNALAPLGTISVQRMGQPSDQHFMIRAEDKEVDGIRSGIMPEYIIEILEQAFGKGEVAVTRSDYVGSRFSKNLTDQVALLTVFTLLLVLLYCSIRFKPWYALGAVIGIVLATLIAVAFVIWTRMEFNTTTIAAILTIIGYSVNNTIVVYDRIREIRRIYMDESLENILNRALTDCLSRTIITTFTTMLAVQAIFIFTKGTMRDFALVLQIGMLAGVFSTMFIASGFINFIDIQQKKKGKKKLTAISQPAKA